MADAAALDIYERDIIISELKRTLQLIGDEEQFRTRIPDLTAQHRKFCKIQSKIEKTLMKVKCFDKEEQLKIRNEFNDCYFAILMHSNKLKKLDAEERRMSSFYNRSFNLPNDSNITKLPTLPLPSFSGEIIDWQSYNDLFKSLVHDNHAYTNVEKFRYLLLTLKGEPFNLIKSIPITEENYSVALDILISRYDNKRAIASKHLDNIFDIPSCADKLSSLRNLINIYQENIKALETMQFPVVQWSFILLHILLRKLPISIRKNFELSLTNSSDIPSVNVLVNFLERELSASEISAQAKYFDKASSSQTKSRDAPSGIGRAQYSDASAARRSFRASVSSVIKQSSSNSPSYDIDNKVCICCGDQHVLAKCSKFLNLKPQDRQFLIKNKNVCQNCLHIGHNVQQCKSNFVCRTCFKRHHSLLHFSSPSVSTASKIMAEEGNAVSFAPSQKCNTDPSLSLSIHTRGLNDVSGITQSIAACVRTDTVLLSTALVNVCINDTILGSVRCMIDTGSQGTLILENCIQRLGLVRRSTKTSVFGVGEDKPVHPRGIVSFNISPRDKNHPSIQVDALILSKLISKMPSVPLPHTEWAHIKNLRLADPNFYTPQPVEMILGADILPHILINNIISGEPGSPIALNSIFGYLLMGKVSFDSIQPRACLSSFSDDIHACVSSFDSDVNLQRFWELESLPDQRTLSPEELFCENLFKNTYSRDEKGQYVVALPFKPNSPSLGQSRDIAFARFRKLEYRLERNPLLKSAYHACLQEYLDFNHMELIDCRERAGSTYYIPHHCVIKESSETTRTRVVFDAGCKTTSGFSLNDILLTGPKLHKDIIDVLLKFRLHKIAFTADIKQMYRYILIKESDRDFQRILWRSSPEEPIRDYRLRTVTFGVSSSPYLALRTLQQLAKDEAEHFPIGSKALSSDVFVDDIVSGENTEAKALLLQDQLISICKTAGFELRKWHSNSPAILAAVRPSVSHGERQQSVSIASMENDKNIKVLGLEWNSSSDTFTFSVKTSFQRYTKRSILSQIARIYDPMGWLGPVILFAKHLLQLLWLSGVGWDDTPPIDIINSWSNFLEQLPVLSNISIPRNVCNNTRSMQLHGFSDASEKAYAACVYLRYSDNDAKIHTFLLVGKTRVASLKPKLTIPRLELMAALLLSKLIDKIVKVYDSHLKFANIYTWSDSTIVLAWLRSSPHEWKTFVSNRTSDILSRVPASCWRHVPSADNPADCASRGMLPEAFVRHELWFKGPSWLRLPESSWPDTRERLTTCEEKRNLCVTTSALASKTEENFNLFSRFSSLGTLVRVVAIMFRFINKCKRDSKSYPKYITVSEYNSALKRLIKLVQNFCFADDIMNISKGQFPSNQLRRLNPFICKDNFLRVGGRLHKSLLSYDSKHQLILPKKHDLTNLLIDNAHRTLLHAGLQAVQYYLLQKYWILSSRDIIRKRIHSCVQCFRARPIRMQPSMGSLPAVRVQPERPFLKTSVDYAGPFYVRANKVRNAKIIKCYVAVFVCMSVKAIHLEVVSELTSEAFLAALRRFTSRRGLCTDIYSDCGKNFVGCNNHLKEVYNFLRSDAIQSELNSKSLQQGITWHFQPPYASHFGGLFEAGVKSFKHHLHRVIGTQTLTYDEMHTLLCQIEAVLNSRPLCVLSADASDPLPLTPSHFLTGGPLMAIPDVSLTDANPNRLTRWQWVQQTIQSFWKRWSREYLHQIQQRHKWFRDRGTPIREGTIVVVCDDNLPPLLWKLARVHALHPGSDNVTRVVTLQMGNNFVKRPVVKICPLPLD